MIHKSPYTEFEPFEIPDANISGLYTFAESVTDHRDKDIQASPELAEGLVLQYIEGFIPRSSPPLIPSAGKIGKFSLRAFPALVSFAAITITAIA